MESPSFSKFTEETLQMNTLILRVGLLLLHGFLNVVLISYLTRYDVSGSWLAMTGFVIALFILLALFVIHAMSFIKYIKHR